MSTILENTVKKTSYRLIPFMLTLYILSFLDRSNIGFAKAAYQLDTGIGDEAYAFGAGIFFVAYAFLGVPANLMMRKIGARTWIGATTIVWAILSAGMAFADTETKFLTIRVLLGAAEAGFFPGMIYLTSQWFPEKNRASIMGLFYMGAPLALSLGSPLSGALLEMHGFMGHPGWFWMFIIEGGLALLAGFFTFTYLDNSPQEARFLTQEEKQQLIEQLATEDKVKTTSSLKGALSNFRVWHLALVYMIIQISVYGLTFFLPTQVAALLGTTVGFKASLIAGIPWVAALIGTYYIPRYADKTGNRIGIAAITLFLAGIGIGSSALASGDPVVAIVALCFAAMGFIAVQPIFWTIPSSLLSGSALAGGIGFINMFGAFGGFLAPNIKVHADKLFNSPMGGLLTLGTITVIGALAILALRQASKTGAKTMDRAKVQ
jgi:Sugar phosphate permease